MATIEKIKASKINEKNTKEVKKLNVCAYCRVSTDMDSQKESFETQVEYYENYIKNNKNWNFVGIYSDYAITGTKAEGRTGFNEMLADASIGKIDIIITKSISRFTRNLFDLLNYLNSFREYGVRIIFEEENIDTISKDFELGLKMRTMLAEEEVRNTSNHVKRAIEMKAENGIASGQIVCYGYDYHPKDKSLTINESEADIVRYIFDSYIDGYGADTIAKNLDKKGIKPKKTKAWGSSTIRQMLRNEKYIGDVVMGKSYTPDPINDKKRKKNNGLKDLIVIHDHHPAIISKEQFKQVQELLEKRGRPRKLSETSTSENYRNQYAFSNKVKCYYCDNKFSRRTWHSSSEYKKVVWGCTNQIKKGKKFCPNSKNIEERIIESAFIESYNALFSNRKGVLEELLETSKNELEKNDSKKKSDVIKKEIEKLKKDKNKLLELKLNNRIDDELFDDKLNQLNNDIKLKETEYDKYSVLAKNDADVMKTLEEFRKSINTSEPLQAFDRAVWDSVIDECIIGGLDADGKDDPYKITFIYKTGDKGSGNGLDYKAPRKNAKANCVPKEDTMYSLEADDAHRDSSGIKLEMIKLEITLPSENISFVEYRRSFCVEGIIISDEIIDDNCELLINIYDKNNQAVRNVRCDKKYKDMYLDHPDLIRYNDELDSNLDKLKEFGFPLLVVDDINDPFNTLYKASIKAWYSDSKFKAIIVNASNVECGAIADDGFDLKDDDGNPYHCLPQGKYTIEVILKNNNSILSKTEKEFVIAKRASQLIGRFNPINHKERLIEFAKKNNIAIITDLIPGYLEPYLGKWYYHMGLLKMYRANDLCLFENTNVVMFNYLIDKTSTSYETEIGYLQANNKINDIQVYYYDLGEENIDGIKSNVLTFKNNEYGHICRIDEISNGYMENIYYLDRRNVYKTHLDLNEVIVDNIFAVSGIIKPTQLNPDDFILKNDNTYQMLDYPDIIRYYINIDGKNIVDDRKLGMERIDNDHSIGKSVYEFYNIFNFKDFNHIEIKCECIYAKGMKVDIKDKIIINKKV